MQYSAVVLALASVAAAVSSYTGSVITPTAAAPSGCATSYTTPFELGITQLTKRENQNITHALVITLTNGVLQDSEGRIGYIAKNDQFQFDFNGQAGEIYTAGFSVCPNNTLALGGSTMFYECLSGTFYNLYSKSQGGQCNAINLDVIAVPASATAGFATATATQASDGQIGGTTSGATGTATVSSIGDHQPQGPTSTPSASPTTGTAVVSSITDHQIQGPTSTPSAAPSTGTAIVSSITDHQIQGPTSTPSASPSTGTAIVSSISDHQIQGPTSTPSASPITGTAIVSSISDHQIQAPTSTPMVTPYTASASVTPYTGAAAMPTAAAGLLLAAAGAVAALL